MRRPRFGLAGAAVAGLMSLPAVAGDPAALLVQASAAARQANYQGVVVYRDARTMEVLRLVHRSKNGQVQERLTSLTGKPRDLLREGDRLSCFIGGAPAEATAVVPQSLFPAMSQAVLDRVARHYELTETGESHIAGRSCQGVRLAPRDEFRYGYEICADRETGVPLRVGLIDQRGQPIEQLLFTEVSFPATIDDSAFALPPGATSVSAPPAAATRATAPWQLAHTPPGFEVILSTQMPDAGGTGSVEHVLLSDGLSAVSVFGAPASTALPLDGASQMGAMNAYGRRVGALHVTVVGEVPASTVRLIGDGLSTPAAAGGPAR